ncbi:hypothetical protein E9840_03460 [Tissierella creatinini]|nr:hypothetical protein E9840_03460 [Tissierella creatinini]TJX63242.1 hypothetical protein E8P77_15430 [Soehngenia saccharolytica]
MNIEKKLLDNNIDFKEIEYDEDIKIYKLGKLKPHNIAVLYSPNNTFKIDRELMFYLSNQNEIYSFWLINKNVNDMFYLEFINKENWLQTSFNRSNKEEIYFGKIILNHKLKEKDILIKLKNY